ncbi:MAG: HEAT repeat domain-containing protein [Caldilineaceae bacterium]
MINSVEEFVRLRTSNNPEEYGRAIHEPVEEQVWLEIINSQPDMIFWVIQNKNVPLGVLKQLVTSPDPSIRRAVARKRKLSFDIFTQLAQDPDEYVRQTVANNPKTPKEILIKLVDDESLLVSQSAKGKLS